MGVFRRGFIGAALSTTVLRAVPAFAQASGSPMENVCFSVMEEGGIRITHSFNHKGLSASVHFDDLGISLDYSDGSDAAFDFVASGQPMTSLRFEKIAFKAKELTRLGAHVLPIAPTQTHLLLRVDDMDTGGAEEVGFFLNARSEENGISYSTDLITFLPSVERFRKLMTTGSPIVISFGYRDPTTSQWHLYKRRSFAIGEIQEIVKRADARFRSGLAGVDPTEACKQDCFLTTACCETYGRADDCFELRTLRTFRDGWLRHQPGGAAVINTYKAVAPAICARLGRGEARRIYWGTIVPSVALIRLGWPSAALALYSRTVRRLILCHGSLRISLLSEAVSSGDMDYDACEQATMSAEIIDGHRTPAPARSWSSLP